MSGNDQLLTGLHEFAVELLRVFNLPRHVNGLRIDLEAKKLPVVYVRTLPGVMPEFDRGPYLMIGEDGKIADEGHPVVNELLRAFGVPPHAIKARLELEAGAIAVVVAEYHPVEPKDPRINATVSLRPASTAPIPGAKLLPGPAFPSTGGANVEG